MRVALTPNLAIDRHLTAEAAFEPSGVNRVTLLSERAGGKGVNLARAYRAMGGDIAVAGFVAGDSGRRLVGLLRDEGFDTSLLVEVEGETRCCHVVRHPAAHPTELLERGPSIGIERWHELVRRLPPVPIVISGSLAPGLAPEEFRDLLRGLGTPPVVDTSGPALVAAVEAKAALVKPNRVEFAELCSGPGDLVTLAADSYRRHAVPLLVTAAEEGALWIAQRRLRVTPPLIRSTNPVASGDAFLGTFLWARDTGRSLEDALRLAAAAGADNARSGGGAAITAAGVFELARQTSVEVLE